jgi:DNA-directed RNA polymerase specialized sigma24 family protein
MPNKPVEQAERGTETTPEQQPGLAPETKGLPSVSEGTPMPGRRMAQLSAPRSEAFPYARLLAYYRHELQDPVEIASIESEVNTSPRWRAHLESVRYLDLERAAASQDGKDLKAFPIDSAGPLCRNVAVSKGEMFVRAARYPHALREETRKEWSAHVRICVYCRRMRRGAVARVEAEKAGLGADEPLLREWLLQSYYSEDLARVTRALVEQFTKKNLRRLIDQLPAELKEVLLKHKLENVPLEELAKTRNRGVEELKTSLQEAYSMVPQLLRKEVLSEIDQIIPASAGSP